MTPSVASLATFGADKGVWQPKVFTFDDDALWQLVDERRVAFVHDEIFGQLAELAETRDPSRTLSPAELAERVSALLGGTPAEQYGCWIYFPWSRRLVHILPEGEFRELRTSRNRNKITRSEQDLLRQLKLGIAGLSVGQATAVTLALEEVGGEFRLADFDALALSNMNRVRAGVHSIGINKAILTAREILEINPFARVKLFTEGIQDANVDDFLDGLDLLFEECDDLKMKVRLRELAKKRKIPVLMETSDRGLFDVERFDLEPDRALFHGLTGTIDAKRLVGMTNYQKVPVVLRIIGAETMSRRMAASLVDIESSLKTWPQLASGVALGGAINTDAARRIALGSFTDSGRFFVDLEKTIANGKGSSALAVVSDVATVAAAETPAMPTVGIMTSVSPDVPRALVGQAILTPSGGNCQPWRFEYRNGRLRCIHDVERSRSLLDFGHSASYLAFGMLAANVEQAAAEMGLEVKVDAFPQPTDPTLVCEISFAVGATCFDKRSVLLAERVTNRRLGRRTALSRSDVDMLRRAVMENGASLQILESPEQLAAIADVLGGAERVRLLSGAMHREMMSEIRWTSEEVLARRDGLDLATLELTPTDLAGMRLISDPRVMDVLRETGAGLGLERPTRKAVEAASAVGLVTIQGTTSQSFFQGGRAVLPLWLAATTCRLAFQPMTALSYMFARLERGGGEGFDARERAELSSLRKRFCQLFDVPSGQAELMLFRVAHAEPPSARSLRRRVDEVLGRGAGSTS